MASPDCPADAHAPRTARPLSRRGAFALALALIAPAALGACKERRRDTLVAAVSVDDEGAKRLEEITARYRVDRSRPVDLKRVPAPEVLALLRKGEIDLGVVEPSDAVAELLDAGDARDVGTFKLGGAKFHLLAVNTKKFASRDAQGSTELAAFWRAAIVR